MTTTATKKTVHLLEIATVPSGTKVDRERGIIPNVKILGPVSANGRQYTESARRGAVRLYEGAKVNVNHRKGTGDRDYRDRLGVIRNVESRSEGLFGDFHYNPEHALAKQLAWDAEHAPENVGFSHDAEGKTRIERGKVLVEEITRVNSVDLVSDPATVRGLFESMENSMNDPTLDPAAGGEGGSTVKQMILDGVSKILDGDGEAKAKATSCKTLVEKLLKVEADVESAINGDAGKPAEADPAATPESKGGAGGSLQEQVRVLLAEKHARKLLGEAKIEATDALVESLAKFPTDADRKSMVESMPKGVAKPAAPEPKPRSNASFTESIQDAPVMPENREDFVKTFRE